MYLNIKYLPVFGKLIIKQLICSLCSILFLMTFPAMIDSGIGEILFSFFAIIVYFDLMYSTTWNVANKHRRDINVYNRKQQDNGQKEINYDKKSGIYLTVFVILFQLLLTAICILMDYFGSPEINVIGNFIYKLWFIEFISLHIRIIRYRYILWILISLFSSIPVALGYFSGLGGNNRFELFVKKLVYKDSNKDSK